MLFPIDSEFRRLLCDAHVQNLGLATAIDNCVNEFVGKVTECPLEARPESLTIDLTCIDRVRDSISQLDAALARYKQLFHQPLKPGAEGFS